MTATEAKRGFRTHFDIINERIQKLEITLKDNKAEFYDLFESSNAQTHKHRTFVEESDKERKASL